MCFKLGLRDRLVMNAGNYSFGTNTFGDSETTDVSVQEKK